MSCWLHTHVEFLSSIYNAHQYTRAPNEWRRKKKKKKNTSNDDDAGLKRVPFVMRFAVHFGQSAFGYMRVLYVCAFVAFFFFFVPFSLLSQESLCVTVITDIFHYLSVIFTTFRLVNTRYAYALIQINYLCMFKSVFFLFCPLSLSLSLCISPLLSFFVHSFSFTWGTDFFFFTCAQNFQIRTHPYCYSKCVNNWLTLKMKARLPLGVPPEKVKLTLCVAATNVWRKAQGCECVKWFSI